MNLGPTFALLYERFEIFLKAPITNPEILWIVAPLVISLFFISLYFSRHRYEELGWNTAFGNTLVLIFVSLNLLQYLHSKNQIFPLNFKISIIFALILIALSVLILHFFHVLPKKLAFVISSIIPMNLTAYVAIVIVYMDLPLDEFTIAGALIFALFITLVIKTIFYLIPESLIPDYE